MEELVVRNTQDSTDVRIINSYPSKVSLHVLRAHAPVLLFCSLTYHTAQS
jgi:hypothetical protein